MKDWKDDRFEVFGYLEEYLCTNVTQDFFMSASSGSDDTYEITIAIPNNVFRERVKKYGMDIRK